VIYQLRIFKDHPGRIDAHIERFRRDTCRLLEKHGAKIVGLWTSLGDDHKEEVVFMAAYESEEHMRRVTAAFAGDPEQPAMVAASEKDGPIIVSRDQWVLQPADFSPLK
jgi:hypothetical protein